MGLVFFKSGFVIAAMLVLYKLGRFPYAFILWKRLWRIGFISSSNIWQNLPIKPFGLSAFLFRNLLVIDTI
jgi:hypothetical protein